MSKKSESATKTETTETQVTASQVVVGKILKSEHHPNEPIAKVGTKSKSKDAALRTGRTTEIRRLGKDELNLIEHPFAILWQKEANDAVIFYQWDAKHPTTGRVLPASWMVSGHRDFGLPNAADERVYLILLELTREAGFGQQTINFSRYDLLTRLGWDHGHRSYDMLERAFERLQGVTITAKNAFWNPKTRSFVNTGFNIIDNYHIETEKPGRKGAQRDLPVSFWRWNDVIFASFQNGYLRTLDLDFALDLKSDIALRLYRYLDKKAHVGRGGFEIELFNLCIRHLGMKPSPYPSKLKERLKPAHDELIARGFLKSVDYQSMKTEKGVKVCYRFAWRGQEALKARDEIGVERGQHAPGEQSPLLLIEPTAPGDGTETDAADNALEIAESEVATGSDSKGLRPEQSELLARMIALKVSSDVARQLLNSTSADTLRLQLNCLDDREPRDPAATLVRAVRQEWELPAKYLERHKAQNRAQNAKAYQESRKTQKAHEVALAEQEKALQEAEAERLDKMWEKLDVATQQKIEDEARQKLGVLGRSGRAQGALQAMRRNLLRERLSKIEI